MNHDASSGPGRLVRAGGIGLVAGVLLVLTPGCNSVYHDMVRQRSESAPALLATRADESLAMHRATEALLVDAAGAFNDPWLREHPLLLWKRLEDRRFEASGRLWEARKRTASIGDVLRAAEQRSPGAPPGEIDGGRRARAERAIELLDRAAGSLESSLEALESIVRSWKGELTPADFDPADITLPLTGVGESLTLASAEVAALHAEP